MDRSAVIEIRDDLFLAIAPRASGFLRYRNRVSLPTEDTAWQAQPDVLGVISTDNTKENVLFSQKEKFGCAIRGLYWIVRVAW